MKKRKESTSEKGIKSSSQYNKKVLVFLFISIGNVSQDFENRFKYK